MMAGVPVFPEWSSEKAVREGFQASYILYAVASDIAGCIRSVPWNVKSVTRNGIELLEDHPLVEMIRSPNTEGTWGSLMEACDLYKSLAGEAYALWVDIGGGNLDLWGLRPDRVTPVPDANGYLAYYNYLAPGQSQPVRYKPEQMLHFKFFDPGSDYHGLAPLQAAAQIVNASTAMVGWNASAMKNRTIPDLMFSPKSPLSPDQHARLQESLTQKMTGTANARKTLIPSEPLDMLQLSLTPVEMDFIQSFNTYEAAICKVYHVHPEAVGALGATFENKEWAIRDKWQGPVTSRLSEMRATMNHKFRLPFGTCDPSVARVGDIYLDFDLSQTPLADYKTAQALDRVTKAWACGMPWNQAAEAFGLGTPPIDGGDVGYISAILLPIGTTSQWAEGGETPGTPARSRRGINLETQEQFQAHYRVLDRRKRGWERGMSVKVSQVFASQRRAVVKAVAGGTVDTDAVIERSTQEWETVIAGVQRAVIADFGQQVAEDLKGGRSLAGVETRADAYTFDPWSEKVKEWVRRRTANDVEEIQTTTKKAIRKTIISGLDEGWDMRKISKAIEADFELWEGGSGAYRSMLIARTEVHAAASYGSHESARQSGVVTEKAWLSSNDPPRARESHMKISGQWIPFEDDYVLDGDVRMAAPGDGPPEEVVNCRCVELFRASG
jgi:HK97 family phage portal protein